MPAVNCLRFLALLVSCLRLADARSHAGATPVTKVMQLLNGMVVKGNADKKDEAERFSAFSQWCGDIARAKGRAIAAGSELMDKLSAQIQKADSRIRLLTDRTRELDEDVGRWQKDTRSATDVRGKEAADYQATAQDYSESIDALTQAIAVLKKQAYDRPQGELVESLVQVTALRLVPSATKKALASFLQQTQPDVEAMPDDQVFNKAPEANAYEFQSGGVVDMLEKLQNEFGTKKGELDTEELNASHNFELIAQQLADDIENAKHEISKKTTSMAEVQQTKAGDEGDLAQTTKDRDEDQTYLDDTKALCATKSSDFESRKKLREEELEVLKKAIDIISSGVVSGAADKHLPALPQVSSLAQLRSSQQSPLQARIAEFLADRAQSCHSQLLSLVSQKVASDPFVKVKKMIKDLISKLMEESTAETEHKGWCDTELVTNSQTRNSKSDEVAKLTSDKESLTALIAQLGQDITDLTRAVGDLDAAMAEASAERTSTKEKNEQSVQEAKDAQVAVSQAISLLKDYYAKSAEATALTQQSPAADAPETFDSPYKGMMPEGGNIVDFMEVILSDFARLEADTSTAETQEQDQHEKFMFESKKDKALKENDVDHKEGKRTDKEGALHDTEAELKATQEQLDAAMTYYEKLKPSCVDSGISYEDRVKKREEEIQSLQEALKILTGNDIDLS